MAKKLRDEEIALHITINGSKAQKELYEIEASQRKLNQTNKDLLAEKKKLVAQNKKGTEEWKKNAAALEENSQKLKTNELRMRELQKEVGINGLNMRQLRSEASRLRQVLVNMIPGSADHKRYSADLDRVNARMKELRVNGQSAKMSLGGLADNFNRFAALVASVVLAITGVVVNLQKLIDMNGKFADAQTNVAKTTGMSNEEIDLLTKKLGLFKTRSARIELLALAEEAGRLGKDSVNDVLEFVKTADKIKVALGDDFKGNVEETIRTIGKLTEQYRVGQEIGASFGEGMEMVGSGINEVAASGPNQAGYLVDVMNRMLGVANQAKIAAHNIMGFGAVLDESGQQVESSTTAMSQVIINMFKDAKTYAGIAGMGVKEFSSLLDDDANEALLRFLQGLNGNNQGLQVMTQKFDDLGVDGTRAITVLSALAGQTDKIREKQKLANISMNEATSLTDEFSKKNSNFAAVLDSLQKKLRGLFLEGGFIESLRSAITWFAKFVGAIDDTDGSVTRFRESLFFMIKAVTVSVATLVSYKLSLKLISLWNNRVATAEKLKTLALTRSTALTKAVTAAKSIYALALGVLEGKIKLAAAAQRAWNLAIKLNPLGLLVSAIAAAIVYSKLFRNEQNAAVSINEEYRRSMQKTQAAANAELHILKVGQFTQEQRNRLIGEINKKYKDYLPRLISEKDTLADIDEIQKKMNKNFETRVLQQAFEKEMEEVAKAQLAVAESSYKLEKERAKLTMGEQDMTPEQIALRKGTLESLKHLNDLAIAEAEETKLKITEKYKEVADVIGAIFNQDNKGGNSGSSTSDELKEREKAQEEIRKFLVKAAGSEEEQIREKYAKLLELAKKYSQKDLPALLASMNEELQDQLLKDLEEEWEITDKNNEEKLKKIEETLQKQKDLRSKYGLLSSEDQLEQELKDLGEFYDDSLLTLEEYLEAQKILVDKYREEGKLALENEFAKKIRMYQEFTEAFGNLINSMKQLELTKIKEVQEKDYEVNQRRGESNEAFQKRKEKAEKQFTAAKAKEEKERHDVEKKYAILQALTTVAKIGTETALAIMRVWASSLPLPAKIVLSGIVGATGLVQSGIAMAEVKKIRSYDTGLYDVIDQNNSRYRATRNENLPSGLYSKPTVSFGKNMLVAEKRPEIVVDPLTTQRVMRFRPDILETINEMRSGRVRSYDGGNYPISDRGATRGSLSDNTQTLEAINETNILLRALLEKSGRPALAILPDKTRRDINERNALDDLIRKNSKINR